jgi:hypothetical protein
MNLQDMALVEYSVVAVESGHGVTVLVPEDCTVLVPTIDGDVGGWIVEWRR